MADLEKQIIAIGFNADGEADFRFNASYLVDMSYDRMQLLRGILCTSIGVIEQRWSADRKHKAGTGELKS